jgi:hypothetical protein
MLVKKTSMKLTKSLKSFIKSFYEGWNECCIELGKAFMFGWRPY